VAVRVARYSTWPVHVSWEREGMASAEKMAASTKMLSTDRLFSIK
jgi:hypothetical protein